MAKVLIVDDDPQFRAMIAQALNRHGFEVLEAADGNEAINLYRDNSPDVAIIDILMPEKDGLEAIQEIRLSSPDARIVAISGGGKTVQIDYLPVARVMGAQQILRKPIDPLELIQVIQGLLED